MPRQRLSWIAKLLQKWRARKEKPFFRHMLPNFELLEDRTLFSVNVWLPQRLQPLDGIAGNEQPFQLFQSVAAALRPNLGLNAGTIALAGSFSLTDTGVYSLSLSVSGPFDANDCFAFTESGSVTFSLTELGTFTAAGFSTNSVVLTQTVSLGWSFLETDGAGHTVQSATGTNAFTQQSTGAAPYDPFFWTGFNWHDPTWQVSNLNSLNLPSLSATNVSVTETNGQESYTFAVNSGTETIQGTSTAPLYDVISQTGQQSYTETVSESFNFTNQGQNTFTLSEQGSYDGTNFAFSSVAYNETGSASFQFNDTAGDTSSGTATASGQESFSGNLHTLNDTSSDAFQFSDLSTTSYSESGSATYTLYDSGSYSAGSFGLDSVNYNALGQGSLALTQTAADTETGTLTESGTSGATDSFGVAGTLTNTDTSTASGVFTDTIGDTVQESDTGLFNVTEQGTYSNGSWRLANFSLTESAAGNETTQQLDTATDSGTDTTVASGAGTDSYALNYASVNSISATGTSSFLETATDSYTKSTRDSSFETAADSSTLTEIGSAAGGSYSLSSYLLQTWLTGTDSLTDTANETASGSGSATDSGTSSGNQCATDGSVSNNDLNTDNSQSSDCFTDSDVSSSTYSDQGTFTETTYEAGNYGSGKFAFASLVSTDATTETWSLTELDSSTALGTASSTDSGSDQGTGSKVYGGRSFSGAGNDTYQNATNDNFIATDNSTLTENGSETSTSTKKGTYANDLVSYTSVVKQLSGSFTSTFKDAAGKTFSLSGHNTVNGSGNQSGVGTLPIATASALGTSTSSSQDSFTETFHLAVSDSFTSTDSWSLYQAGSFANGSWGLSSVVYGENYSASSSSTRNDSFTDTGVQTLTSLGTTTGAGTTVYGGGTVTNGNTVSSGETVVKNYTDSNIATLTSNATSTWSLTEKGTYGSESFAFASVVYQGGDSVTETLTSSASDSYSGTRTGGAAQLALLNTVTHQVASTDGGGGGNHSYSNSGSNSINFAASHSLSQTVVSTDVSTFYEDGTWNGDRYSLTSIALAETATTSYTLTGNDTASDSGLATSAQTWLGGVNDTVNFGGNASTANTSNFTSTDGINGSGGGSSTDSYTDTGNQSWSLLQLGTYSNFRYSFATITYQSSRSDLATVVDGATVNLGGTYNDSGTATNSSTSNGAAGNTNGTSQGCLSQNGTDCLGQGDLKRSSDTVVSTSSESLYELGRFANESFSLSCVAYSASAIDTWNVSTSESMTDAAVQTRNANSTVIRGRSQAFGGASSAGQDTSTSGDAVTGMDTLTASNSILDSGSDSWTYTEKGTYGSQSFAFGSVVYQATASSSGTMQATDSDTFRTNVNANGTRTAQSSAASHTALNIGGNNNPGGSSAQDSSTTTATLGFTVTQASYDSQTDYSTSSSTLYEDGTFAGGSFAFTSMTLSTSGTDSFTAQGSTTDGNTVTLDGQINDQGSSSASPPGSTNLPNTLNSQGSSGSTQSMTRYSIDGHTDGFTMLGGGTYAWTVRGRYNHGSYTLDDWANQASESNTISAQETDTKTDTLTESDSNTDSSLATAVSLVLGAASGGGGDGGFGENAGVQTITQHKSSSDSVAVTKTIVDTGTVSRTDVQTFSDAIFQDGNFSNGSYSCTNMTYSVSSTDSSTTTDSDSVTSSESVSVSDTVASDQVGASSGDQFSDRETDTYSGLQTVTDNTSSTELDVSNYALYEAGNFSGANWALSSVSLAEQDLQTVSSTETTTQTDSASGSNTVLDVADGHTLTNSGGTFNSSDASTAINQQTTSSGWGLAELGTYSQGAFGLSSYVHTDQASSNASASNSGTAAESFSGNNQGQAYSGGQTSSFSSSELASSSDSLSEQGTFANGAYSLSTVGYAGSGQDSFTDQSTSTASWTGGFSGTQSTSAADSGTESYSASATGSFASGSWSLSSYLLSGTAAGSYSSSEGDQESLGSSASSFSRGVAGQESDSLYQSGTQSAGTFSNASYNFQDHASGTATNQATGMGFHSSDTWTSADSTSLTGSGSSGNQTITSAASFTFQVGYGSSNDSNSQSASSSGGLPAGAVNFANPDPMLVPATRAGQSQDAAASSPSSAAPVSLAPDLGAVAATRDWVQNTHGAVDRSVGRAAQHAAGHGVNGNAVAPGGGPGQFGSRGASPGASGVMGLSPAPGLGMQARTGIQGVPGAPMLQLGQPGAGPGGGLGNRGPGLSTVLSSLGMNPPQYKEQLQIQTQANQTARINMQGQNTRSQQQRTKYQHGSTAGMLGGTAVGFLIGAVVGGTLGAIVAGPAGLVLGATVGGFVGGLLGGVAGSRQNDFWGGAQAGVIPGLIGGLIGGLAAFAAPVFGGNLTGLGAALSSAGSGGWLSAAVASSAWEAVTGGLLGGALAIIANQDVGFGIFQGAFLGAITGFLGSAISTPLRGLLGCRLAGFIGSASSDAVAQFAAIGMGWQDQFSVEQMLFAGGMGALFASCFAAGTPLRTPEGARLIENFQPGDLVLSRSEFDPEGPVQAKVVEEVFVRFGKILQLRVHGRVVQTTAEHPLYLYNKGWVKAKQLRVGDLLLGEGGRWVAVEEVIATSVYQVVYNLRIADYHTYFVGSQDWGFSVWAHNAGSRGTCGFDLDDPNLTVRSRRELGQFLREHQGSDLHHPVFRYILRGFQRAGVPIRQNGRMPRQGRVPLSTNEHRQLHDLWDTLYPHLRNGDGASRRVAQAIQRGQHTPQEILSMLENFYRGSYSRSNPQLASDLIRSIRQMRGRVNDAMAPRLF